MKKQIDDFYVKCMSCKNAKNECKGIWNNIEEGVPPRGFLYKASPVKILVVSKNPGFPTEGEPEKYKGKSGESLLKAYRNHQSEFYGNLNKDKDRSHVFHRNTLEYFSFFLGVPNNVESIYRHIAHTNLVKCSNNYREQDKLNKETMEVCYKKFLLDEIKIFQPKVLIALGREVEKFLRKKESSHKLPVIYIKHPSYYYRKEKKTEKLLEIKNEINKHLNSVV